MIKVQDKMSKRARGKSSRSYGFLKKKKSQILIRIALLGLIIYFFIALAVPFKDRFLNLFFPKSSSQAALLINKEAEFYSNQLLIKVAKKSRGKFKVGKGNDTGIGSLNALVKKYKVVKIQQVARPDKNSNTDEDVFNWYLLTLQGQPKIAKGLFNKDKKEINPVNDQAKAVLAMADDFKSDANIADAEPDVFVSSTQTSGCETQMSLSLEKSSVTVALGGSWSNTLFVKNNGTTTCGPVNISSLTPSSFSQTLSQSSVTVAPGQTVSVPYTMKVLSTPVPNPTTHQMWLGSYGAGEVIESVRVGSSSTPTPTPGTVSCINAPQFYLQNTSIAAAPGQTVSNTLYFHNTNDPSCGSSAALGISYSYPTGWTVKPAQTTISATGGETVGVPISITVDPNATTGSYTYQLWVASWGPFNGTVQVSTAVTPNPTDVITPTLTATTTPVPTTPVNNGVTPNDPYFSTSGSWGQPFDDQWGLKKLGIQQAWEQSTGSPDTVIAVIDSGVDGTNPDLKDNMWVNTKEIPNNGIDDDGNGYIDDYNGWNMVSNNNNTADDFGHGTMVAGVIAAEGNNGIGMAGVDWHAKIMPIKMLGSDGTGSWSAGAQAIVYAADNGAKIANMSWGANAYSQVVEDALRYAHSKGMILVAAAGNDGVDMTDNTPAGNEQVISVGAVDINDARSFSYWSSDYGARLDVAAPGMDILTTKASTASCLGYPQVGSNYCSIAGTSLASPFVTGVAGLLVSKYPNLTNEQVRQIIRESSVDLGIVGDDIYYGYGRLNAANAMDLAASGIPLAPDITSPVGHSSIFGVQTFNGSAAGNNFADYTLEAGLGNYPSNWIKLASSSTPVNSGAISSVDTSTLPSGTYTFRLTANTTDNKAYQFQTYGVNVNNQTVTPTPTPMPTPTVTSAPTSTPVLSSAPTSAPTGPQNLIATALSSTQVQLTWQPPTSGPAVGVYNIYRNGNLITQGNILQYTDKNLLPNTTYTYYVVAQYIDGTKSPYSNTVSVTTPAAVTPTPTPTPTAIPTPTPTPDVSTPSASLTSPVNGTTVTGQVALTATASDNVGVTKVEFVIDGTVYDTVDSAPYSASWDTTILTAGSTHTLVAKAYDAAGNVGTSKRVTVTIGDTTPPNVTITNPTNGSTVSDSVNIDASASDNQSVQRVDFYVNGTLKESDLTAPYEYVWDSREVSNGTMGISATAYDTVGNKQTDSVTVNVANADITPPSTPTNVKATATTYSTVNVSWSPSSDNVGVAGYYVIRNGSTIGQTTTTNYTDSSVNPSTSYEYQIVAYDAAGNNSQASSAASVTTPQAPDTEAPTSPANLVAVAVSTTQVNVSWDMSTDNIGVVGYKVYRDGNQIATVTGTSFGDTGLTPSTSYTYSVVAYDAAGNVSPRSNTAVGTTLTPRTTGDMVGTVFSSAGGVVAGANVTVYINGHRNRFTTDSLGQYGIFDVNPGTYSLKFDAKGYSSLTQSVAVTADTTTRKDVTLNVLTSSGGSGKGRPSNKR